MRGGLALPSLELDFSVTAGTVPNDANLLFVVLVHLCFFVDFDNGL